LGVAAVKLYVDANIIIYGYEADEPLRSAVMNRLARCCIDEGGKLTTSVFSRLECRVAPIRNGDANLLADYDEFFRGDSVEILEVSRAIIDLATSLRAQYGFKSPDAIHLASAVVAGAQVFFTGDAALAKYPVIDIELIDPDGSIHVTAATN
jgi:uncharacterized protein